MTYETLDLKVDARGVAYLYLDRPDKHNCINATMLAELTDVAAVLDEDSSLRAVVISGHGDSFCAGADLAWMRANIDRNRAERIAESRKLAVCLNRLGSVSKLVIGRVNGQAYGGGIGLISICDIAIGVVDARFSLTEVKLGLTPANISPFVIRRLGKRNARRTMLNAHFFKGVEAAGLGLLDRAVTAEELDVVVEREVSEALNCAPRAIGVTKRLIETIGTLDEEGTMDYTAETLATVWEDEEALEGVSAFFDKRKPNWVPE